MLVTEIARGFAGPSRSTKGLGFLTVSSGILGGSWVVISGVISPLIWVITIVTVSR